MNPYRELGKRAEPACMYCLTYKWVTWCPMWACWECQVCGDFWGGRFDPYMINKISYHDRIK